MIVEEYAARLDDHRRRRELLVRPRDAGIAHRAAVSGRVVRSRAVPRRARASRLSRNSRARSPSCIASCGPAASCWSRCRTSRTCSRAIQFLLRGRLIRTASEFKHPGDRPAGEYLQLGARAGFTLSAATASFPPSRSITHLVRRHPRALAPLHRALTRLLPVPGLVLPEPAHVPQALTRCSEDSRALEEHHRLRPRRRRRLDRQLLPAQRLRHLFQRGGLRRHRHSRRHRGRGQDRVPLRPRRLVHALLLRRRGRHADGRSWRARSSSSCSRSTAWSWRCCCSRRRRCRSAARQPGLHRRRCGLMLLNTFAIGFTFIPFHVLRMEQRTKTFSLMTLVALGADDRGAAGARRRRRTWASPGCIWRTCWSRWPCWSALGPLVRAADPSDVLADLLREALAFGLPRVPHAAAQQITRSATSSSCRCSPRSRTSASTHGGVASG